MSGPKAGEETPAKKPASRSNEKGNSDGGASSHRRRETESSSVSAMEGGNTSSKHASNQGKKKRKKIRRSGNDSDPSGPGSANGVGHQPPSAVRQGNDINGSRNSGSNFCNNNSKCSDSISVPKKQRNTSSNQSSTNTVENNSRNSSISRSRKKTADLTVQAQPSESSDESSSTDDNGSEIDLRAKTGKELYTQGEHSEDEDDSDSSEVESECAVQASFGLFDPSEEDKDAIGCLLRQSVLQSDLKFSTSALQQLATTIAEQGNVGSTLKTVDDDEDSEMRGLQGKFGEPSSDSTSVTGEDKRSRNKSVHEDTCGAETPAQREGESGTVVGFLTLLSFRQYPDVVAPFKEAIIRLAGEHASAEQRTALERILLTRTLKSQKKKGFNSKGSSGNEASGKPVAQLNEVEDRAVNCGWLLKERLSNTPPQLIPRMYDSLLDDISWSLSTEEMDEAERPFYAYSHVCGLTKVYKESDGRSEGSSRSFKKHKMSKGLPFEAIFPHPEDELLLAFATQSFAWPTGRSAIAGENVKSSASSFIIEDDAVGDYLHE